jgi:hypothetical protein
VTNERVVTQEDMSRVGVSSDGDFNVAQMSEICNRWVISDLATDMTSDLPVT